jgi:hypothetical protein
MRELMKDSHIRNELVELFNGLTRRVADRPLHDNPMDRPADIFDLASARPFVKHATTAISGISKR